MLDVDQIVATFYSAIFAQLKYLIPILFIIGLAKSAWFKGYIGELLVRLALKVFLDSKLYQVINNVTLEADDGTTQIDHIVVSPFGIFVVETKNMKGWIFGSEKQRTWTQKIYKKNFKFQNPLHQNYKHTQTLAQCLDIEESLLISVVVFVGESTFKTEMPNNVTYGGGLTRFIKNHKERVLDEGKINKIVKQIQEGRLKPSFKTDREHVRNLKQRHSREAVSQDNPVCPKCGNSMVKRLAKKGGNAGQEFWGCSTFPKCRAVVQTEDTTSI
ncbi:NERD domain-containing protein [Litoribrevibacter albus]|uniref:DNA-binding protein n=1 Tax=Litoribrevibacter albus TaxID=1473156 RepID=A0AA37SCE7_9GAMM|nr:NERD domain-containing protein [Litoribrevibacter albus]GLQ33315.1 DNA-binding protein [Litoribrevibacter albus]